MKTLVFINNDNTYKVEYKVDLGNSPLSDTFSILEIIGDPLKFPEYNLPSKLEVSNLSIFKKLSLDNNLSLQSYSKDSMSDLVLSEESEIIVEEPEEYWYLVSSVQRTGYKGIYNTNIILEEEEEDITNLFEGNELYEIYNELNGTEVIYSGQIATIGYNGLSYFVIIGDVSLFITENQYIKIILN